MGNGVAEQWRLKGQRYEVTGHKCELCGGLSVNGRAVCMHCGAVLESRPSVPRGPAVAFAEQKLLDHLDLKRLSVDGFALDIGVSPATVYRAMGSLGLQKISERK